MHTATPPNRISELLKKQDRKLVHLAAACDVDQSTAFRWTTGASPMTDEKKAKVAEFFGVSRAHLMRWDEEETPAA